MNTDEPDVRAALRRAVDQLAPPRLDLNRIRRVGRRRKLRVAATAALAAVVAAACAATVGLLLVAAPHPSSHARPIASGSDAAAVTNVRAFYRSYPEAAARGQAAVDALIRARVASWYAPILEASPGSTGPPGCEFPWTPGPQYQQAGLVAGQAVVVARWRTAAQQELYRIATTQPGTGKITGLACAIGGENVTSVGAKDGAMSLYIAYVAGRRQGISILDELKARVTGGPDSTSAYLQGALTAAEAQPLGYDPVLCTKTGPPVVSLRSAAVIAGGSVGLVTLESGSGRPILAVIVLGAQGLAVADIACQQP